MFNKKIKIVSVIFAGVMIGSVFTGCAGNSVSSNSDITAASTVQATLAMAANGSTGEETSKTTVSADTSSVADTLNTGGSSDSITENSAGSLVVGSTTSTKITNSDGSLITTDMFTSRDLEQEADLTSAQSITLTDGQDVDITAEGIYIISGTATDVTINVETTDEAKVQLVLDGVNIINSDAPAIYVKSGDKVFVTTTNSDNSLEVTGTFVADGTTNLDAVIFSKSDLVLNGLGTLTVTSAKGNGITSKDDLKVTGGIYTITANQDGIEANDSIVICDGTFTIKSEKDAIHSENEDDLTLGYIYISGGTFNIMAADDAIQGTSIVQIDGGTINISSSAEGIEGTYIIINDGAIDIYATDDGINATNKSTAYDIVVEFNGGSTTIKMGAGDTDAVDSNGSIYVNGGTIDITATSSFDYNTTAKLNGGTVIVNGQQITEIPASMMGGGRMGGNRRH